MNTSIFNKVYWSVLVLTASQTIWNQKQNYVWKFGHNGAGLDFENCVPHVLTNGIDNLYPYEGQSAISDNITGELLFYTDGYNVYDSSNEIMLGGLGAALSVTMTQTIIVKRPGTASNYYIFTPGVQAGLIENVLHPGAKGLCFAEVDMSLNSGLGMVTSSWNILLDSNTCENLTAVYHDNGTDIWLIGHEYNSSNFYAFQITAAGINPVPFISSAGPLVYTVPGDVPGNSRFDAIGELRSNITGNKLAYTTYYNGFTCIVDFNKATGTVSSPIQLDIDGGGYGVSFSPNGNFLYVSVHDVSGTSYMYQTNGSVIQFDISSGVQSTIQASKTTIYSDSDGAFRSLKVGPDAKLYVSQVVGDVFLDVIHNPNLAGTACGYEHNAIDLGGLECRWGLNNSIEDTTYCDIQLSISDQNLPEVSISSTQDELLISIMQDELLPISFVISDLSGRTFSSGTLYDHVGQIEIADLQKGIYLVTFQKRDWTLQLKFINE